MLAVILMQCGQSDSSMHGLLILTFRNLTCHAVLFTMSDRGLSPTSHVWGGEGLLRGKIACTILMA